MALENRPINLGIQARLRTQAAEFAKDKPAPVDMKTASATPAPNVSGFPDAASVPVAPMITADIQRQIAQSTDSWSPSAVENSEKAALLKDQVTDLVLNQMILNTMTRFLSDTDRKTVEQASRELSLQKRDASLPPELEKMFVSLREQIPNEKKQLLNGEVDKLFEKYSGNTSVPAQITKQMSAGEVWPEEGGRLASKHESQIQSCRKSPEKSRALVQGMKKDVGDFIVENDAEHCATYSARLEESVKKLDPDSSGKLHRRWTSLKKSIDDSAKPVNEARADRRLFAEKVGLDEKQVQDSEVKFRAKMRKFREENGLRPDAEKRAQFAQEAIFETVQENKGALAAEEAKTRWQAESMDEKLTQHYHEFDEKLKDVELCLEQFVEVYLFVMDLFLQAEEARHERQQALDQQRAEIARDEINRAEIQSGIRAQDLQREAIRGQEAARERTRVPIETKEVFRVTDAQPREKAYRVRVEHKSEIEQDRRWERIIEGQRQAHSVQNQDQQAGRFRQITALRPSEPTLPGNTAAREQANEDDLLSTLGFKAKKTV